MLGDSTYSDHLRGYRNVLYRNAREIADAYNKTFYFLTTNKGMQLTSSKYAHDLRDWADVALRTGIL